MFVLGLAFSTALVQTYGRIENFYNFYKIIGRSEKSQILHGDWNGLQYHAGIQQHFLGIYMCVATLFVL